MEASSQVKPKVKVIEDKLTQQFKHLQREWDSFKQANPQTFRRRSSISKDARSVIMDFRVLNGSPRNLVSSLQENGDSSAELEESWTQSAAEELRRERRAAIQSGKLKGRRLFEDSPEVVSELINAAERDSSSPVACSCSSDSSLSLENVEREKLDGSLKEKRLMAFMGCLAIVLMVFVLGIITVSCFSGHDREGDELILVPT